MGLATHFGPWLIGTVKYTTGTTSGLIRNVGATVVAQTKAISFNDAATSVAFCLPAGSFIVNIQCSTTTTYSSAATIICYGNGTQITNSLTITNPANSTPNYTATAAAMSYLTNTGTTPTFVTYTISGTALSSGNSTLYIQYIVRNADGTYTPNAFTGP